MGFVAPYPTGANGVSYVVRLVLHNATPDTYEDVHRAMAEMGFIRAIMADSGKLYDLPDGEYWGVQFELLEDVRDWVVSTVSAIHPYVDVLVTEAPSAAWLLHPIP